MRLRALAAGLLTTAITISAFAQPPAAPASHDEIPGILMSRQLLESQHLSAGDVVSLSSSPDGRSPRPFRIVGSYEPTPDPMQLGVVRHEARLHLPDLLSMTNGGDPLDVDSVDSINVAVGDKNAVGSVGRDLAGRLPGVVVERAGGG